MYSKRGISIKNLQSKLTPPYCLYMKPISPPPSTSGLNFPSIFLQSCTNQLGPCLSAERLGALDRSSNCAINDELWENTNGTGYTEQDSVVAGFGKTVVLEEDTRVGINVRVSGIYISKLFKTETFKDMAWEKLTGSWSFRAQSRHLGRSCKLG